MIKVSYALTTRPHWVAVVPRDWAKASAWGGSKRWTFSQTVDKRWTIVTLPYVSSAVCIAQNWYFTYRIRIPVLQYKFIKVRLAMELARIHNYVSTASCKLVPLGRATFWTPSILVLPRRNKTRSIAECMHTTIAESTHTTDKHQLQRGDNHTDRWEEVEECRQP